MALIWVILIPLLAAPICWWAGRARTDAELKVPLIVALLALLFDLVLVLNLFDPASGGGWWLAIDMPWIPRFGITLSLALDGLGFVMLLLALVLGIAAAWVSAREICEASGAFYATLMLSIAGVLGVFLAVDLFLFFLFWELMLVPVYFLIAAWGHGDAERSSTQSSTQSAIKFFIYTQASGLLMLLAIVALVWLHFDATGELTFAFDALRDTAPDGPAGVWLLLGFLIAFAVKLPAVPLHGWLPDAHTDAPTGGSVILAGILLKTGAYGLLRFGLPLFPDAAVVIAPYAMWLGVVAVLYGAWLAYAQTDFKRLVAYSSISHMGFVLIGIFALNIQAWQGAVMQMIAHGLSTAALFVVAGILQRRLGTREMSAVGGLWQHMPVLGGFTLLFAIASIGLPGLANFIGEFLVLLGAYKAHAPVAVVAALGLVLAAVYGLVLVQRSFHGPLEIPPTSDAVADATVDERMLLALFALLVAVLGVQPQLLFDVLGPWLDGLAVVIDAGVGS